MEIKMEPIGYIKSDYKKREDIPRQSIYSLEKEAVLNLNSEYKDGIHGYEVGDKIVILFNFHRSEFEKLIIKPHGRDEEVGVFKTRSPNRPNPIGMSIVEISKIEEGSLHFKGVDMLDNTPVLDIKPYIKALNPEEN